MPKPARLLPGSRPARRGRRPSAPRGRWLAGAACILAFGAALSGAARAQEEEPPGAEAPAPRGALADSVQFGAFLGQVVSASTGKPLEGAVVTLLGSGYGAITDSAGNFRVPRAPAGADTVEVRYIGFEESQVPLEIRPRRTTRVVLLLSPTVVRIADLEVEIERERIPGKMQGFWERRERGFGYFFSPEEIEDRRPLRRPSDLLREVPGLRVERERFGQAPVYLSRRGRSCEPPVYLDGMYMANMRPDDIAPEELGAVEVYRGPSETPPEFMRLGEQCGAIVIWTPVGGTFPR